MLRRNWSNQLTDRRLAHEVVHTQAGDRPTRPHARVGAGHGAGAGDRVDHHMGALAAGVLHDDLLDLVVIARVDRQRRAEGRRRLEPIGVVAEADDPLGALGAGAVHARRGRRRRRRSRRPTGRGRRPPEVRPCQPVEHHVHQRQQAPLAVVAATAPPASGAGSSRRGGPASARTGRPARRPRAAQTRGAHPNSDHFTQDDARPSRHQVHSPQATEHDDSTRSPAARPVTSGPTASTVPMNSWPRREPGAKPNASPAL